jgi:peptidoglycan/xylan/chitin deacetylase (PgdA/CDA1 family)
VLLCFGAYAAWLLLRSDEPSYQGRTLTSWIRDLEKANETESSNARALAAIQAMAPQAIPFLLRELQAQEPPWALWLDRHWPSSADRFSFNSGRERGIMAFRGFKALGNSAEPAIPLLQPMLLSTNPAVVDTAQEVLFGIGGDKVVPCLRWGLTNADANIRYGAAFSLGRLRSLARPAAGQLFALVDDPSPRVRLAAVYSCGAIGADPEPVLPALIRTLSHPNQSLRFAAIRALAQLGTNAASAGEALEVLAKDNKHPGLAEAARRARIRVQCEMHDGGIVRGPKDGKVIALMFAGHTYAEGGETILNELARHDAKAAFFLTGDFLSNPKFRLLVERVVAAGDYLGPHSDKHLLYCSWDQPPKTLVSRDQFATDLLTNLGKIASFNANEGRTPFFLPPYEHWNRVIADWAAGQSMVLVNFTPGTRSTADSTGEGEKEFVSSQAIFDSVLKYEQEDPAGLNGFLLLLHIGSGPGRADKFHTRFGELLDHLAGRGYRFVRIDELLGLPRQVGAL